MVVYRGRYYMLFGGGHLCVSMPLVCINQYGITTTVLVLPLVFLLVCCGDGCDCDDWRRR